MDFIAQPDDEFRLGNFLTQSLNNKDWTDFRAAVAFVKRSGTKHVRDALADFSKRATVRFSTGIDSGGTSAEGLQDLIAAVGAPGKLWLFHNLNSSTFHPKIYLFKNATAADLVIGSGKDFWVWPGLFVVDKAWSRNHAAWIAKKKAKARRSTRPLEKMDRNNVRIRIVKTGSIVNATMWYNPEKTDLRIRHAQLRAGGNVGDILAFKAAPTGAAYDYDFEVVPPTDAQFAALYAACNVSVAGNSRKRFGYI